MRRLILHHRYGAGLPWDVSGRGNHGIAQQLYAHDSALRYHVPQSRVDVPQSPDLYEMGAFRCSVTFRLDAGQHARRNNLAEGHVSFALMAGPGGMLHTTIVNRDNLWRGASATGLPIHDGQWHRADCGHDGLSTSWVALDGRIVAVRNDVPGPVRPIGRNGLSIGHWPEPSDGGYTLKGSISEVWLWHDRPDPPSKDCCVDRSKVAEAEKALRDTGFDRKKLADFRQQMRLITSKVDSSLSPEARASAHALAPRLQAALTGGRWAELGQLALQARTLLNEGAATGAVEEAASALSELVKPLLSNPRVMRALDASLCVPDVPPQDPRPDRPGDPYEDPVDPEKPRPGYPPGEQSNREQEWKPGGPHSPRAEETSDDKGAT